MTNEEGHSTHDRYSLYFLFLRGVLFGSTIIYGRVHRVKWLPSRTFTVAVLTVVAINRHRQRLLIMYCRRHEGILTFLTKLEQTKPDMDEKGYF